MSADKNADKRRGRSLPGTLSQSHGAESAVLGHTLGLRITDRYSLPIS